MTLQTHLFLQYMKSEVRNRREVTATYIKTTAFFLTLNTGWLGERETNLTEKYDQNFHFHSP